MLQLFLGKKRPKKNILQIWRDQRVADMDLNISEKVGVNLVAVN